VEDLPDYEDFLAEQKSAAAEAEGSAMAGCEHRFEAIKKRGRPMDELRRRKRAEMEVEKQRSYEKVQLRNANIRSLAREGAKKAAKKGSSGLKVS
jgi:hypothetical protein